MRIAMKTRHVDEEVRIVKTEYPNGRMALVAYAINGEPVMKITTNLPDFPLPEGPYAFIKDYSENEGVLAWLLMNNLVSLVDFEVKSRYVEFPLVKVLI